jgi:hypothetical protein
MPRRPQKRRTHLTQRRRQHEPLRRRRPQLPAEIRRDTPRLLAEVLAAKLHTAFQNTTNAPKTPTSPALESTPTSRPDGEVPLETKLCMRSGATQVTAQKSRTLKLGIQQAAFTAPQQHLSTAERPLKDYVQKSTDVPTKTTRCSRPASDKLHLLKKYKALHDLYIATESKNRGPCNMMPEGHTCRVPRKALLKKAPDRSPADGPRRTPHQ